jgi:hypothetical protein
VRYDAAVREADRCALYFNVDLSPGRPTILIKVREDRQGRVTGSSDVSDGDASCCYARPAIPGIEPLTCCRVRRPTTLPLLQRIKTALIMLSDRVAPSAQAF